eukprot:scaffold229065_cov33-Tisochrysis_lutea.AAC.3
MSPASSPNSRITEAMVVVPNKRTERSTSSAKPPTGGRREAPSDAVVGEVSRHEARAAAQGRCGGEGLRALAPYREDGHRRGADVDHLRDERGRVQCRAAHTDGEVGASNDDGGDGKSSRRALRPRHRVPHRQDDDLRRRDTRWGQGWVGLWCGATRPATGASLLHIRAWRHAFAWQSPPPPSHAGDTDEVGEGGLRRHSAERRWKRGHAVVGHAVEGDCHQPKEEHEQRNRRENCDAVEAALEQERPKQQARNNGAQRVGDRRDGRDQHRRLQLERDAHSQQHDEECPLEQRHAERAERPPGEVGEGSRGRTLEQLPRRVGIPERERHERRSGERASLHGCPWERHRAGSHAHLDERKGGAIKAEARLVEVGRERHALHSPRPRRRRRSERARQRAE